MYEYDLFVSFSSNDRESVLPVVEKFNKHGYKVFISDENLKTQVGKPFLESIQHALKCSQHFVMVCSPYSAKSGWVEVEFEIFFNNCYIKDKENRRIIVLKGNGFDLEHVPLVLQRTQFADNAEQIVNTLQRETIKERKNSDAALANEKDRIETERQTKSVADKKLKEEQQKIEQDRLYRQKLRDEVANQKRKDAMLDAEKAETVFWQTVFYENTLSSYRTYLKRYPGGKFATKARQLIGVLEYQSTDRQTFLGNKVSGISIIKLIYLFSSVILIAIVSIIYLSTKKTEPIQKSDIQQYASNVVAKNNSLAPQMVLVKGGEFRMGDNNSQYTWEKPAHKVIVPDFYIGKYEVTQKEWTDIMGNNPSSFKGCDNCPVESVSWNDVHDFIKKLNQKTGKTYRLPTEAEWEYAAGGGANNRTKWAGTNLENELGIYAWYDMNSGGKPHPVGTKKPNNLGIYDMSGNVWEWCIDWYASDYYNSAPLSSPKGAPSGLFHVVRGGSWNRAATGSRVANRDYGQPDIIWRSFGFRLLFAWQLTSEQAKGD